VCEKIKSNILIEFRGMHTCFHANVIQITRHLLQFAMAKIDVGTQTPTGSWEPVLEYALVALQALVSAVMGECEKNE
jgi:hypothetical protein